jgi:hypothetical protein
MRDAMARSSHPGSPPKLPVSGHSDGHSAEALAFLRLASIRLMLRKLCNPVRCSRTDSYGQQLNTAVWKQVCLNPSKGHNFQQALKSSRTVYLPNARVAATFGATGEASMSWTKPIPVLTSSYNRLGISQTGSMNSHAKKAQLDEIPFHSRCGIVLRICCACGRLPNDGTSGSIHDGSCCRNRPSEERRAALHRR